MMQLDPVYALIIFLGYFVILMSIAWWTSRGTTNAGFFLANKSIPWYVVAYAMIGTSISGVTFISVPGKVGSSGVNQAFSYLQIVLGYLAGYLFIATILMPLYYRLNLTSIYSFLEQRFGKITYKTGAVFFLISRTLGSAARMYLAAMVLQLYVMEPLGIPFAVTVIGMLALIYSYTFRGGLQTIIWTDTVMTTFFLCSVIFTVYYISNQLHLGFSDVISEIRSSGYGKIFFFENFGSDPNHFVKQFISGALIATVMTGMDQDLMQKNLACRNIKEAQKNMFVFCIYLVIINILFLTLGALLYMYANKAGVTIPQRTDQLYPILAFEYLGPITAIFFILGLTASTYSSSDSALTALTTSFCVDILNFEKQSQTESNYQIQKKARTWVHAGFSLAFVFIILILHAYNKDAVINLIMRIAGYTYGPLLALFLLGLFTKIQFKGKWVPWICCCSPVITWLFEMLCKNHWKIDIGFLIILINGIICAIGLYLIRSNPKQPESQITQV